MLEKEQLEQQLIDSIQNETPIKIRNNSEQTIFNHIRNFAIQGREYSRSGYVLSILKKNSSLEEPRIQKKIYQKLVACGELTNDYPTEVSKSKIPIRFKKSIFDEIRNLPSVDDANILDLSSLQTYTIDNETTKDRDDAFSIDDNVIWIHITDVSSIIQKDSEVDKEAFNRGATLYMPEGTIPMLPRSISEQIGSLNPNQAKKCLSLKLTVGEEGQIINSSFHKTLVKNNRALSYKEADTILTDQTHPLNYTLKKIRKTTEWCRTQRYNSGAFELLTRDEIRVTTDVSGKITVQIANRDSDSNLLIAELMITYNWQIADFLKNHNVPASYKVQKSPNTDELNRIPNTVVGNHMISRVLRPAMYSRSAGWHFGLGLNAYVQATSPLRRYSDLCIQRQITHYMETKNNSYSEDEISNVCHSVDTQVKNLSSIERSRTRYWFLKYLNERYLSQNDVLMEAIALENSSDNRTFFQLARYPYKGKCIFNEPVIAGETVTVKLLGIDLWERTTQFSHVKQ